MCVLENASCRKERIPPPRTWNWSNDWKWNQHLLKFEIYGRNPKSREKRTKNSDWNHTRAHALIIIFSNHFDKGSMECIIMQGLTRLCRWWLRYNKWWWWMSIKKLAANRFMGAKQNTMTFEYLLDFSPACMLLAVAGRIDQTFLYPRGMY